MPFVPATTYGHSTLGANSAANKLLLTVLFSDPYFGIQFLNDVGPHSNQHGVMKCGSKMSWCVDTIPPTIISVSFMCVLGHRNTIESRWRHVKVFHSPYNRIGELRLSTNRQCLWRGANLTTWTAIHVHRHRRK